MVKVFLFIIAFLLTVAAFAWAETYTVIVSVDNGMSWRPVPLPARIVRTILDEMAFTHAKPGQERKPALIKIKMADKKQPPVFYAIGCHAEEATKEGLW